MRFTEHRRFEILELVYPVGHCIKTRDPANPATYWGFGTWVAADVGKFAVGVDPGDSDFNTVGETGGAKTVTLDANQIPAHNHAVTDPGHTHLTQRYPTATGGNSGFTIDTSMSGTLANNTLPTASATTGISTQNTGGGQAHNNLPPYQAWYFWERTA